MQTVHRYSTTRRGALVAVTLLACSAGAAATPAADQKAPAPAHAKGANKSDLEQVRIRALRGGSQRGPMVTFTQAVHFIDAKGQDVVVGPGDYQVALAGKDDLTLTPSDGLAPVTIDGQGGSVQAPVALSVPMHENEHHLVLLLPHGKVVEVEGSTSGIRSRWARFGSIIVQPVKVKPPVDPGYPSEIMAVDGLHMEDESPIKPYERRASAPNYTRPRAPINQGSRP